MAINSPAMTRTIKIAYYMLCRFKKQAYEIEDEDINIDDWTLTEKQEMNQLVDVLVRAYINKKTLPWLADNYRIYMEKFAPRATGRNPELENDLRNIFPPYSDEKILMTEPFLLCDEGGNILMWYLPGALKKHRQNAIRDDLKILQQSFITKEYGSSWRTNSDMYMKPSECKRMAPGTVSMAPAWYQQAHEKTNSLEVSSELRKERGLQWVAKFSDTAAMLGGLLAIMHPSQFSAGIRAMEKIYQDPELVSKAETLSRALDLWTSPFTGLSVISNRLKTPIHRDNGSGFQWLDLLATIGKYVDGYMDVPGAGIEVAYGPGTLVAIAGKILAHGVSSDGERACIAQYMKEKVVGALIEEEPQWANISYLQHV